MLLNGESKYNGIFTSLYLVREKLKFFMSFEISDCQGRGYIRIVPWPDPSTYSYLYDGWLWTSLRLVRIWFIK